ncbi:hypothetical protein C0J52_25430 [Blattella germanica]|nr:hypothetical protein C0J52_25430 [Blattella germanica]
MLHDTQDDGISIWVQQWVGYRLILVTQTDLSALIVSPISHSGVSSSLRLRAQVLFSFLITLKLSNVQYKKPQTVIYCKVTLRQGSPTSCNQSKCNMRHSSNF